MELVTITVSWILIVLIVIFSLFLLGDEHADTAVKQVYGGILGIFAVILFLIIMMN